MMQKAAATFLFSLTAGKYWDMFPTADLLVAKSENRRAMRPKANRKQRGKCHRH